MKTTRPEDKRGLQSETVPVDHVPMYGESERARRVPYRAAGIVALIVVVITAGAMGGAAATRSTSWFPKQWDARVAPITETVSRLRDLEFKHPVPVRFLSAAEFEKEVGGEGSTPSASGRADTARLGAVLRGLGLLGGKVDFGKAASTANGSDVLAFYSPERKEIVVRGSTLDVAHRVTIAHELTHVLQDQNFDLDKLEKRVADSSTGDSDAFRALVEGDAVRIQNLYVKSLSSTEQHEYDRENDADARRIQNEEGGNVPDVVDTLFGAPYVLGPATAELLAQTGGNAAIDRALTGSPPFSRLFLAPADFTPARVVTAPVPPPGATADGDAEPYGPYELYLTLAMHMPAARALEAADGVAGGNALAYRKGNIVCYAVALATNDSRAGAFVQQAVRDWASAQRTATVDPGSGLVRFHVCDPGTAAPAPPSARFDALQSLLELRTGVTIGAARSGAGAALARCLGRVFVMQPGAVTTALAVGDGTPSPDQEARIEKAAAAAGVACRADSDAGLP